MWGGCCCDFGVLHGVCNIIIIIIIYYIYNYNYNYYIFCFIFKNLINSHVFTMNLLKTLLYKVRNTYTLVDN